MHNIENNEYIEGKARARFHINNMNRTLNSHEKEGILFGWRYYGHPMSVIIERLADYSASYAVGFMEVLKEEASKAINASWETKDWWVKKRANAFRYAMDKYRDCHNDSHDERRKKSGHSSGCDYCRHTYSTHNSNQ